MKRLWLFVVAQSLLLASCSWMPGPMDPKCDEKTVREFPSPDGRRKAVEIHSTCEGGFYHSTIEIADGRDRATAMHASPSKNVQPPIWPELKVEWKSATELWIKYPADVNAQCISSPPGAGSPARAGFARDGVQVAVHCVDASIVRQ